MHAHEAHPCTKPCTKLHTHLLLCPWCRSYKVWDKEKKELHIREEKSTGHAKCTRCVFISTLMEKFKGRADAEGKSQFENARCMKVSHDREHLGERDCAPLRGSFARPDVRMA